MKTETVFDRVPGSGDLKRAKRAANFMLDGMRRVNKNHPNLRGPFAWSASAIRRKYARQAMLKDES